MKLRRWIFGAVALILMVTMVLPAVGYRHRNDEANYYYTAAVDASLFARQLPLPKLKAFLKEMKAAGCAAAVVREEKGSFSKTLLEAAAEAGLEIAPEPDLYEPSSAALERLMEEYPVRYIKLNMDPWQRSPTSLKKCKVLCEMIRKEKLTLVLTETLAQLSNNHPAGFEDYLKAADGRILRSYANGNLTYSENGEYPFSYYHTLCAVLDRNIRFPLAVPLEDEAFSAEENASRMVKSTSLLCQKLKEEGFSANPAPDLKTYPPKRRLPSAAVAAIGLLMLGAVIDLSAKGEKKWLLPAALAASGLAFGASLLLPDSLLLLYPTAFAAIAGCFCPAVVFEFISWQKGRGSLALRILFGCLLAFGLLLFCGLCQGAMMNGWDYWLNEAAFRGVKFSLVIPILFALIWQTRADWSLLRPAALRGAVRSLFGKVRWYHGLILLLGLSLAGLYIIRSGNVSSISFLETRLRDGLTELLLARPRTKEFLFGWPCLILLIYEQGRKGGSKLFCWILSAVAAVLFASGINTFCHAFTPILTMVLRLIYGLIGGLLVGALFLGSYMGILRLYRLLTKKV